MCILVGPLISSFVTTCLLEIPDFTNGYEKACANGLERTINLKSAAVMGGILFHGTI